MYANKLQNVTIIYTMYTKKLQKMTYLHHVYLSVRSSVRTEELVSHWTDFHENLYLGVL